MQMIATAKIAKIKTKILSIEKYNDYANGILCSYLNNTERFLEFEKYTQTNAYIEEVTKERYGLVKDGEILFVAGN